MKLRAILSLIIVTCGALIGRAFSARDRRRARLLAETMDSIKQLEFMTVKRLLPLKSAMALSDGYIMREIGERHDGKDMSQSWKDLLDAQSRSGRPLDSLRRRDIVILNEFFKSIPNASMSEAEALMEGTVKMLGEAENSARVSAEKRSGAYSMLGVLAGIAVATMAF